MADDNELARESDYRPESLLNKAAFRRWCLKKAQALRPGVPWDRVSASFIEKHELGLMARATDEIRRLPSVGRTIK